MNGEGMLRGSTVTIDDPAEGGSEPGSWAAAMPSLPSMQPGSAVPNATLEEMQAWARSIMGRGPDYTIGADYLRRWWVIPRNPFANIYLHEIVKSDDDRAFHDHPWDNRSFLIFGRYIEHTPDGDFERKAGDVIDRAASALHWLEAVPGETAVSLFMTGPKIREWGFACPQGWVHWTDFTSEEDSSQVGRGCGEHGDPVRVTPIGQVPA